MKRRQTSAAPSAFAVTRWVFGVLLVLSLLIVPALADVRELLQQGMLARLRGDNEAAIYYISEAIKLGNISANDLAVVLAYRGVAYEDKGDVDSAIADFNAAITLNPQFWDAYNDRGLSWAKKGEYDRAIADFTEASRAADNAYLALNNRGNVYALQGNLQQAIADYSQSIILNPRYPSSYKNRADTYNELDEVAKALADYDAAIALNPDFVDAYTNRGVLHLAEGEADKAIVDFDLAVQLAPQRGITYINRGTAYLAMGNYERALRDFDEAVRVEPRSPLGYINRGIARFYSEQAAGAIEDLTVAAQLAPSSSQIAIWLYYVRARSGQADLKAFADQTASIDRGKWPGVIIDLYLRQVAPDTVQPSLAPGATRKAQRNRECEFRFYLATFDLLQGRQTEARRDFQKAVESCAPGAIALAAAKAELAVFDAKH